MSMDRENVTLKHVYLDSENVPFHLPIASISCMYFSLVNPLAQSWASGIIFSRCPVLSAFDASLVTGNIPGNIDS
jgi:hypothetical protein